MAGCSDKTGGTTGSVSGQVQARFQESLKLAMYLLGSKRHLTGKRRGGNDLNNLFCHDPDVVFEPLI